MVKILLLLALFSASVCEGRSTISFNKLQLGMGIPELNSLLPSTTLQDSAFIDRPNESGFYRRFYPVIVNDEVGVLIVKIGWGLGRSWAGSNDIAESFDWIRDAAVDWAFPPSNVDALADYSHPVNQAVFARVIEGFEQDLGGPIAKAIMLPAWHGWSLEYCEAINSIRMSKHSEYESCERDWFSMHLTNAIGLKDFALGSTYAAIKAAGAITPDGALDGYKSMAGLRSLEMVESLYGIPGRTLYVFEADSLVMSSWSSGVVDLAVYLGVEKKLIQQFGEGEQHQAKGVIGYSWSTDRSLRYLVYTRQGKELVLASSYFDFKDRYDKRIPAMQREMQKQDEEQRQKLEKLYRN